MTKEKVLENLKNLMVYYGNNYTKYEQLKKLVRMVSVSTLETFKNISMSKNGHVNIGNIVENLVLNFLGLETEDENHEVKSLVVNTANILVNEDVKTIYILAITKNFYGLYRFDNAQEWNGKRIGAKELAKYKKQLVKVATCNAVAKCLH